MWLLILDCVFLSREADNINQPHFMNFKSTFFSFLRKLAFYLQLYWPSYWLSMLSFISDCPQMLTLIWNQMKISWAAINAWKGYNFIKAPLGTNTFWSTETARSWIFSAGIFSLQKYLLKCCIGYQEKNLT